MKEKLNFNKINLNEDFRDTVKKDLNSKIYESASIPKLGKVQIGKGYKKPFAENNRLTEMEVKNNFSFRDPYLESLDFNDGGKPTSTRLKEAEELFNKRNNLSLRRRNKPLRVNSRVSSIEDNSPSMQDALDAYLAKNKNNNLTEARTSIPRKEDTSTKGMSMQDALDAYLAKNKDNALTEARTSIPRKEDTHTEGMSMQDALDAYLAREASFEESRRLPKELNKASSFKEKSVNSNTDDVLFFVVKTPNGKYLCKDESNKLTESLSFEIAEAYETFDEAESDIRNYAEKKYADKVSNFEIRGIEESDFKEKQVSPKKNVLKEKKYSQKDITVNFPVSVNTNGYVKASDAKRLLKYLYSSKQLRVNTQYFVKDINGEETNWDFDKNIFNNGYQYCFSCEVWDDNKDIYQALFISKDYKGRLDWSDTEWTRESVK